MKYKKDYYKILGIEPNATPEEIKQAYRRLAILNHPDKNQTRQAVTRMQEVNEAYSVLGNNYKRANYDFECKNFSTSSQASTTPNYVNVLTTTSLEQFYPKKLSARYSVLLGIGMLFLFALFFLTLIVRNLSSSGFSITWSGLGSLFIVISLLSLIPTTLGVFFLTSFISFFLSKREEKQCPKCGKVQVAEKMDEKLMGIFKRVAGQASSRGSWSIPFFTYGKYKIHYKCKLCSYEWFYIKSVRL